MYGTLRSLLTAALIPGLVLWTPGTSVVLSQEPEVAGPVSLAIEHVAGIGPTDVEAMRARIDDDWDPRVAEIAGGLLDAAGANPRVAYEIAQDAQIIHNATTNAREMVEQVQVAVPQLYQELIQRGVSAEDAAALNEALADAQTALAAGTIDTAGEELKNLQEAVIDVQTQLGDQTVEALLGGPEEAVSIETHDAIEDLFDLGAPEVQNLDVVDYVIADTIAEAVAPAIAEGVPPTVVVPVCQRLDIPTDFVLTESTTLAVRIKFGTEGEGGPVSVVETARTEADRDLALRGLTEYLSNPALTPEARQQALDAWHAWEGGELPPVVIPPHQDEATLAEAERRFNEWIATQPDLTPEDLATLKENFEQWKRTGDVNHSKLSDVTGTILIGDAGVARIVWLPEDGPTGPAVISPGSLTADQRAIAEERFQAFLGQNPAMSQTARADLERDFRRWLDGDSNVRFGPGSGTGTGRFAEDMVRNIFDHEHRLYQVFDGRMPPHEAARAQWDMNREFMYRAALASGDTTMADRIAAEAAMQNVRPGWVDAATWERMGITFQEATGGGVVAMPPEGGWGAVMHSGPGPMGGMGGPVPHGTVTVAQLEALRLNSEQIAAIGDGSRSTGFMSREEMRALGLTQEQMFQVEAAAGYAYGGPGGPGGGWGGPETPGGGGYYGGGGNWGINPSTGQYEPNMGSGPPPMPGSGGGYYVSSGNGAAAVWHEGSNYGYNPSTGGWEPNMGGTTYTGGGYAGGTTDWSAGGGTYGGYTGGGGWTAGGGYTGAGDPAMAGGGYGGYSGGYTSGGTNYGGGYSSGGSWDPATSGSYTGGGNYGYNPSTGGWEPNMGGTTYTGGSYMDPAAAAAAAAAAAQAANDEAKQWHCHYDHDHDNDSNTEAHCELTTTQ